MRAWTILKFRKRICAPFGLESFMSAGVTYRFDLLNDNDDRNCLFIAQCFGDEHAVLLARVLFDSAFVRMKSIKVWRDDVLVHEANKSRNANIN